MVGSTSSSLKQAKHLGPPLQGQACEYGRSSWKRFSYVHFGYLFK